MTVDPKVEKVINDFYNKKKVIGACCISPMLLAKTLGKKGVNLTLGCKGGKKILNNNYIYILQFF